MESGTQVIQKKKATTKPLGKGQHLKKFWKPEATGCFKTHPPREEEETQQRKDGVRGEMSKTSSKTRSKTSGKTRSKTRSKTRDEEKQQRINNGVRGERLKTRGSKSHWRNAAVRRGTR